MSLEKKHPHIFLSDGHPADTPQTPDASKPSSAKRRRLRLLMLLLLIPLALLNYVFQPCSRLRLLILPPNTPRAPILDLSSIHSPSDLRFSVKHIFHHNTNLPHGQAAHGRFDVTPRTLPHLKAAQPFVTFGMDSPNPRIFSPWDGHLAIRPRHNFAIRRLSDRHPDSVEGYVHYANTHKQRGLPEIKSEDLDWRDDTVSIPDTTDRDTIVSLAVMSADAYVDVPYTGDWQNVSSPWHNETMQFGWATDGVRGHIFVSEANEKLGTREADTVVIAIKGTSAAIFDDGGDTAPKDKVNDNLLFSCCCARVSYMWNTVCDCYTGSSYTCNQDCLERELYKKDRYYKSVMDIYRNVSALYPTANVWVTGHSLGGSLASMLGRTYGLPTVAFEAPGELLPSHRLHLPMPPGVPRWAEHIWHFGHTADPIYVGTCNGAGSSCWVGGYAMETSCHSGLECTYDVVSDKGWHVSLINHRIHVVIDDVILAYNETAECRVPKVCADCFDWNFVTDHQDDSREPVKSSTSTTIATKTTTSPGSDAGGTATHPPAGPTGPISTVPPENDNDGAPEDPPEVCKRRTWYGRCLEWGSK